MGDEMPGLSVRRPHEVLKPSLSADSPQERMGALYGELAERVATTTGQAPMVVAGDCVASIGVLAGMQRRAQHPVVLWFDAHGDFHTWETTGSDFIGGMPLAMLTGRGEQTIRERAGASPLRDEDVILVGARDLDPGETEALDASAVTCVGVSETMAAVPEGRPLYVHIDADVVDPRDMPAMNYPAPHGPSLAAVAGVVADLAATGRVVGWSVSSWNPELPGAERASAAVEGLIDEMVSPH